MRFPPSPESDRSHGVFLFSVRRRGISVYYYAFVTRQRLDGLRASERATMVGMMGIGSGFFVGGEDVAVCAELGV